MKKLCSQDEAKQNMTAETGGSRSLLQFYSLILPPSSCSVTQSWLTLCDPMDFSTPGLTVPHLLPEFAQVHVHCIGDAIQPSHPLMPSSALSASQHQGLFQ